VSPATIKNPYSTRQGIVITDQFFRDVNNFIRDNESSMRRFNYGMDFLVQLLARTAHGYAQKLSAGPVDPQGRRRDLAFQLPVRRITGRYYFGWKIKKISMGIWLVYNDSREAYFIEYGIHPSGRRVRRPVSKLTALKVARLAPKVSPYFTNYVFNPRRGVQSPPVMYTI
jgi:hypothetical protein